MVFDHIARNVVPRGGVRVPDRIGSQAIFKVELFECQVIDVFAHFELGTVCVFFHELVVLFQRDPFVVAQLSFA